MTIDDIMQKFINELLTLLIAFLAVCCGGDDATTGGDTKPGANANANTTEKSSYATRLEVPRVEKGNNYLFLVKRDSEIGVNYIIEWDCMRHAQRWVCWHWTKANSYKGFDRKNWSNGTQFNGYGGKGDPFQPDTDIPAEYRSELSDYSGSGYNRGHMCASEDRICSQNVNGQTFYLSNMHPQISGHNSAIWSTMENKVRTWRDVVVSSGGEMFIAKGGTIYEKGTKAQQAILGTIGKNKLPVPKYFFMAILKKTAGGTYSAMAFWSEHKNDSSKDLKPYMITIDELEARTGYDFFCNLPDNIENSVESIITESEWR